MEQGFIDGIQKMVKDYGKETLLEARKAKAMLGDFTQNNFPKETNLLKQLLDANCANIINEASNVAEVKTALVKKLEDEQGLSPKATVELLDLLGLVLRGDTSKTGAATAAIPGMEERYKQAQNLWDSKRYDEAVPLFQALANEGHALSCYYLAVNASVDGSASPQTIAEWYRKAAEQGHVQAQAELGSCYKDGKGVPQNAAQALEWFHKAAAQGWAGAQCSLGECYENGTGVPQDYAKAIEWYLMAEKQGSKIAQMRLGFCFDKTGDYAKAAKYYRIAVEAGGVVKFAAKMALDKLQKEGKI